MNYDCMPYNLTRSLLCPTPQTCPGDRDFYKVHKATSYEVFGGAGFGGIKSSIMNDGPPIANLLDCSV